MLRTLVGCRALSCREGSGAGGALKDIIEAPSLDVVRALDARTNVGYAVEAAAASESEPEVHEDYVSAYGQRRVSTRRAA